MAAMVCRLVVTCLLTLAALFPAAWTVEVEDNAEEDLSSLGDLDDEDGPGLDPLTESQMQMLHSKFDSDKDGLVSLQDIMNFSCDARKPIVARRAQSLLEDDMDRDQDGKVSLQEFVQDMRLHSEIEDEDMAAKYADDEKQETEKFKVADSNSDGFLDATELRGLVFPETHEGVLDIAVKSVMTRKDADKDGKLTPREFWEVDALEENGGEVTDDEASDFLELDADGDGLIDMDELRAWESGTFQTEQAFKGLFRSADEDNDMKLSLAELLHVREKIGKMTAQYHMLEWAEHFET